MYILVNGQKYLLDSADKKHHASRVLRGARLESAPIFNEDDTPTGETFEAKPPGHYLDSDD
jgi:hypothetical protein